MDMCCIVPKLFRLMHHSVIQILRYKVC